MSTAVFTWPADDKVEDVIVTGTFDNWSKTLPLVKQSDGSFSLEVPIKKEDTKIEFKFVLNDQDWVVNDQYWTVVDESGNVNNYIEFDAATGQDKRFAGKTEASGKTEVGKTIIPESGLSVKSAAAEAPVAATVMPGVQLEGDSAPATAVLGGPGPVVPEDVSAFSQPVRDVDAKALNAEIKANSAASAPAATPAPAADKDNKNVKYVKRVVKKVPATSGDADAGAGETSATNEVDKDEPQIVEKPAAAGTPSASGTSSSTTAKNDAKPTSTSAKKERRGLFGRIKRALN